MRVAVLLAGFWLFAAPVRAATTPSSPSDPNTMSRSQYLWGGVVGTAAFSIPGLGHTIQGRWMSRGWIYTAGRVGSTVIFAVGISGFRCCRSTAPDADWAAPVAITGLVLFTGFWIAELVDLWGAPTVIDDDRVRRAGLWWDQSVPAAFPPRERERDPRFAQSDAAPLWFRFSVPL